MWDNPYKREDEKLKRRLARLDAEYKAEFAAIEAQYEKDLADMHRWHDEYRRRLRQALYGSSY